jgi:hypothetical protein
MAEEVRKAEHYFEGHKAQVIVIAIILLLAFYLYSKSSNTGQQVANSSGIQGLSGDTTYLDPNQALASGSAENGTYTVGGQLYDSQGNPVLTPTFTNSPSRSTTNPATPNNPTTGSVSGTLRPTGGSSPVASTPSSPVSSVISAVLSPIFPVTVSRPTIATQAAKAALNTTLQTNTTGVIISGNVLNPAKAEASSAIGGQDVNSPSFVSVYKAYSAKPTAVTQLY